MVNSGGHLKKKKSDTSTVLATHKYLGSKGAEINKNEIFMDLPHISHSFYTPNSPLLLWSDALVLLTFPQTKKIHFGHT